VFSAANQLFRQALPSACRLKADKRQKSRNTSRAGRSLPAAGGLKGGDERLCCFAAGALMPLLRLLTLRRCVLPPDESR